jgi:hypothetical protein
MQDLHVTGIGGGTIKYLRGPRDAPHLLCAQRVFEIAETCASKVLGIVIRGWQEEIPNALGARTGLEFLDTLRGPPTLPSGSREVGPYDRDGGVDLCVHEVANAP